MLSFAAEELGDDSFSTIFSSSADFAGVSCVESSFSSGSFGSSVCVVFSFPDSAKLKSAGTIVVVISIRKTSSLAIYCFMVLLLYVSLGNLS